MIERFYIDRFKSNNSRRLLPLNGQVFSKVVVEGKVKGRTVRSVEVGKSGLSDLRNDIKFNDALVKSQMNAMYQFKTRYGASGETILKVLDVWVDYPKINGYRTKRVNRKGKYYTYIFDEKGKIKTYSKWKYITDKDIRPEV